MKRLALIGLAAAAIPGVALAQAAPPNAPSPPDRAAMRAMHDKMAAIHRDGRAKMLAALSPEHRTMLATVVGDLATSPSPDVAAAAQRIDAALSPSESKAVLAAADDMRSQMRAAMTSMRGDDSGGPGRFGPGGMMAAEGARRAQDAGVVLLHAAAAFGGPRGFER